jgi:hypothetical protein
MQYPATDIGSEQPSALTEASVPGIGQSHDPFSWDFAASGSINVHMYVYKDLNRRIPANQLYRKPQIEFGVKFDSNALGDASVSPYFELLEAESLTSVAQSRSRCVCQCIWQILGRLYYITRILLRNGWQHHSFRTGRSTKGIQYRPK